MRYTEFPLPQIAYVPGVTSRPTSSALTDRSIVCLSLSETGLHNNSYFLFGIDLFNNHFFWEAHESWEDIWHLEQDDRLRNLLQGLIQLSGGFLKVIQGNETGVRTLWSKAKPRLPKPFLNEIGIELDPLLDQISTEISLDARTLAELFHPMKLREVDQMDRGKKGVK